MFSSSTPGRVAPKGREPNLPGDRYGRLTLVEEVPGQGGAKPSTRRWACVCDCGTITNVILNNLRKSNSESCGCVKRGRQGSTLHIGQVFERLTLLQETTTNARHAKWLVRCQCGVEKEVAESSLKAGTSRSCGCLQKDLVSKRFATHHRTGTRTYRIWLHMVQRCTNPESPRWWDYGGRGIGLDPRWRESFQNFFEDMGECPAGLSIDRSDNEKGYSRENCRWATAKEQARNQRSNRLVRWNGKNICLAEAAEIAGLPYKTAHARLTRHGWSISRALGPEFSDPT